MIRKVKIEDTSVITSIYNYYIKNTIVTFEEFEIDEAEMKIRILDISAKFPWIVFEENGQILGYAYADVWKTRAAYKNTIETTVYLNPEFIQKGVGSKLYTELLDQLIKLNFHAIIGVISFPNEASITLHEKFGFEKVAHFKEVGYKFNKWIDVGFWELMIPKESKLIKKE
jgi:phosphinothricin acetyltransferase